MVPGQRYAFRAAHPASPMLRIRYRAGVAVGPSGVPDWIPYARAVVELPPPPPAGPDLGIDEARVRDVLTANETMARAGDPLWRTADGRAAEERTPDGWTWAPLAGGRRIALVPAELFGAFRHRGGAGAAAGSGRRGLPGAAGPVPAVRFRERLTGAAIDTLEQRLGFALPAAYRDFLARTNGGRPAGPAVHPGFGFVADQRLFGLARPDWLQDLVYANAWFGDRFTADWLAVGYVQGGLIVLRVRGADRGSVWYWDDDNPRDRDEYPAEQVCRRLLHRCADDFTRFWWGLRRPPARLRDLATADAAQGRAVLRPAPGMGAGLPAARLALAGAGPAGP